VRDELRALIREGRLDFDVELRDDTSLIRSGVVDSLGLFNLALWIEARTGAPLDLAEIDPPSEWDTIDDIVSFVERRAGAQGGAA
jgi:acyl carrier protein